MRKRAYVALVAALIVLPAVDARCSPRGNPWTVVTVREPRPGDVPFEDASKYLRPSEDANNVPGPDSLLARVRTDEMHHAYIEIEDLRTGNLVRLQTGNSCLPNWSPDGKYIACLVWKSRGLPHELVIADVETGRVVLDPKARASATTIKWSPKSQRIAVEGTIHSRPKQMLYVVALPRGRVMVLDTVGVLANYGFSWSPDGRWIAFSRPTKLDNLGEVIEAADLWIADAKTGDTWPLLETPESVESNPLWVTNSTIQIDRAHWDGQDLGARQRLIVELSRRR
jgi:dipeptidyl aminopeptidase/acylaminoacyl peptidase